MLYRIIDSYDFYGEEAQQQQEWVESNPAAPSET